MMSYLPVPVSSAVVIAETCAKSQVVILAWDPVYGRLHRTTYGQSAFDKENAAALGEKLTEICGGDLDQQVEFENFHADYNPALCQEALQLLNTIVQTSRGSPAELTIITQFLNRAGFPPGA